MKSLLFLLMCTLVVLVRNPDSCSGHCTPGSCAVRSIHRPCGCRPGSCPGRGRTSLCVAFRPPGTSWNRLECSRFHFNSRSC
ncbi:hypothetical protein PF005_g5101 [Phytophthora fragariae]|uniref:Secreted protein n=1 Tax=Phytophthora fragariae TaxID=53985 RepID=A0A6A3YYB1_9STRA|nr:hypothetical protein PF003_g40703 [Phytophthora fragariae]KAE9025178.1 hypothetical protein PF011_g3149 [Phytophthora fragariae]KAE9074193.1 hypothetical protein PF010_g24778 [Phytophthora fragariae]KAE9130138.1 hypothetical protein PF007_g4630 [Phytophthora fragariae]KAE9145421.1 hypothetical protein PF006_g9728 [Phytophthora fragariae]